jgi:hypothetical protein
MEEKRFEEAWNSRLETYIKHMRDVADSRSQLHEKAGYHFKKRNNWFGLPSVLVPLIMAPASLMLESANIASLPFVNACGFMLTGIFTGVYSFFKYGEKMERHFAFSARYADIVTDIESELIKERKHRIPADVMTIKIKMSLNYLNNTAPVITQKFLSEERNIIYKDGYEPIKIKISKSYSDMKITPESVKRKLKKNCLTEKKEPSVELELSLEKKYDSQISTAKAE